MDKIDDFIESEKNYKCKPDEVFADVIRKKFYN